MEYRGLSVLPSSTRLTLTRPRSYYKKTAFFVIIFPLLPIFVIRGRG